MALLATTTVWAEDYYITDVMVIGGSKSEVDFLKVSYMAQGWTVINQDLNAGCGSSSDYIYLLYKSASETNAAASAFITDFVISTLAGTIPDNLTHNGRSYTLVPYDGSDYFKNNKGDLNSHCGSSSATIHLYYTKEYNKNGEDYGTVKSISFNNTQSGAVTTGSGTTGYDLNSGAGGDYIYMHTDKAHGWTVTKNTAGTECIIKGFDGPKTIFKDIIIPTAIDSATVLGFSGMDFSGFTNLETMFFFNKSSITHMPSVRGCSKFYNVMTQNFDFTTPPSMTSIPGYAFAGTAIKQILFESVTSVGTEIFSGCDSISSVTFNKSPVLIDNGAFSNISSNCQVLYPGSIEDWNPMMYMYSPNLVIKNPNNKWYCGWCGAANDSIYNHLYWMQVSDQQEFDHLKINCATDVWDTFTEKQVITTKNWVKNFVHFLTIEHVHHLNASEFEGYNFEFVDVKSGLEKMYYRTFHNCTRLKKVNLPSTVTLIDDETFSGCIKLTDIYFDGTDTQWNDNVIKGSDWKMDTATVHWHCTVIFNANGHGTAPDPVSIQWSNEDKLDEPTAPTANGYNFLGWFTDADCTNQWDFNNTIPGDMTLYAGWQEIVVNIPGDVNGDGEVTTVDVTAIYNYLLNGDQTFIDTCDVNGDGFITSADITVIYNILLGN